MDEPRPSLSTQLSVPPRRDPAEPEEATSDGAGPPRRAAPDDAADADGLSLDLPAVGEACLEVDELVAMVDGALPPERSDQVLAHVDRCQSCADLVGTLGSFDDKGKHPRKLGRYQLERLLGVGGMGMVYVAWDPELQRQVAMKLVRPEHASDKMRARMLGEARALARVSHPHVMSVYDVGEHDGEIFLATELVDGETLGAWQAGRGLADILRAWVQVARGLAAAHAEGVVHRDVKPSNALVGRDGRVRIGDFGIAYQLGKAEGEADDEAEIVGTPAYMAPEQRDGAVDARADQFSVCVGLVEALARKRPGADDKIELVPAQLAPLATALTRGLRRDPAERFASMTELADALEAALASAQAKPAEPKRRWRAIAAALAAGVALVSIAVVAARVTGGAAAPACAAPALPASLATAEARAPLRQGLPADPEPMLGRWIEQWQAAAGEVCGPASPPALRAKRIHCLDEQRAQLERLLARLRQAPPAQALQLFAAFDELPRASRCAPRAVLASEDFALADKSLELLLGAGSAEEAARHAETARKLVAGIGDPFLEGRIDFALGQRLLDAHQTDEAMVALESARRHFREADGADGLHEAVVLVSIAGAHYQRDSSGASNKAGDEAFAAAGLIFRKAGIDAPIGPPAAEATALIAQLEELYELAKASGAQSETAFHAEYALAGAYVLADKPELALAHYRHTAELGEALGLQGERLVYAYSQIAALVVDAFEAGGPSSSGLLEGAVAPARRAVALAERIDSPRELAGALNAMGRLLLARGEAKAARAPLARALELRIRSNEPARFRGGTRFLLAQAMWRDEPAQALELAHAARADLQAALATTPEGERGASFVRGAIQARLAELDRWLAEHQR